MAIRAAKKVRSDDVLALLTELFTLKGVPDHIRSDTGQCRPSAIVGRVGAARVAHSPRGRQTRKGGRPCVDDSVCHDTGLATLGVRPTIRTIQPAVSHGAGSLSTVDLLSNANRPRGD